MRRREFVTLLGSAVVAWPIGARSQQAATPVIGSMQGVSAGQWTERMAGFQMGLGETGYVEGRNVAIEYRWAEGHLDRLPAMATDLVSRRVAVMFVSPDVGVQVAMAATKTIPIVFTTASDPVAAGFVPSLGRPGGNVTGIAFMGIELAAKRLELLHVLLPRAARIALLVNPNNPGVTLQSGELVIQGSKGDDNAAVSLVNNVVKVSVTYTSRGKGPSPCSSTAVTKAVKSSDNCFWCASGICPR